MLALRGTMGQGDAIRALAAGLPARARAWPAVDPQALPATEMDQAALDRLLAVLRSLSPLDRLGLGLHLLLGMPRDEIDRWLGSEGVAERIAAAILRAGLELELTAEAQPRPECVALGSQILDVADPQLGRRVRLHLLGCDACAARVAGVHRTREWLRDALEWLFPPRPPRQAPELPRARSWKVGRRSLRLGAVSVAALLAAALLIWRPNPAALGTPAAAQRQVTAAMLLDRALRRLEPRDRDGVLHERFRIGGTGESLVGERWIEYRAPQRMRLVLHRGEGRTPLLDLTTDGQSRLRYAAQADPDHPARATVEDPRVAELMPILRQLPSPSALGSFPSPRMPFDLTLLIAAQHAGARLLGTTTTLNRPAYLLAYSDTEEGRRIVLTVDAETSSLLRATSAPARGNGPALLLWATEAVEVLAEAPGGTFDLDGGASAEPLPNPRHLLLQPFSNLTLPEVSRQYLKFPMPADLPADATLAYLRNADFFGAVQVYEGEWMSLAIVAPHMTLPTRPELPLPERTARTWWRLAREDASRGLTQIEFAPASEPMRRSHLYLWHPRLNDEQRQARAIQLLDNMRWMTSSEMLAYEDRFIAPPDAALGAQIGPLPGQGN